MSVRAFEHIGKKNKSMVTKNTFYLNSTVTLEICRCEPNETLTLLLDKFVFVIDRCFTCSKKMLWISFGALIYPDIFVSHWFEWDDVAMQIQFQSRFVSKLVNSLLSKTKILLVFVPLFRNCHWVSVLIWCLGLVLQKEFPTNNMLMKETGFNIEQSHPNDNVMLHSFHTNYGNKTKCIHIVLLRLLI